MADNYLEKRMEELRSGRLTIKAKPGIRPGGKRILIAGGCHGEALEKALEYRRLGHRVAIFDEDETAGKKLAHDHGIRFTRVTLSDPDALAKETQSLLNAWRGLDLLIANDDAATVLSKNVTDWKESLPIPDESSLEIVITENYDPS